MDGISAFVAEWSENKETYLGTSPSVLLHLLVHILPCHFSDTLQRHQDRLNVTFSIGEADNVEGQQQALSKPYRHQSNFKSTSDRFDAIATYRDVRQGLYGTYASLERFFGGLAIIFTASRPSRVYFRCKVREKQEPPEFQ